VTDTLVVVNYRASDTITVDAVDVVINANVLLTGQTKPCPYRRAATSTKVAFGVMKGTGCTVDSTVPVIKTRCTCALIVVLVTFVEFADLSVTVGENVISIACFIAFVTGYSVSRRIDCFTGSFGNAIIGVIDDLRRETLYICTTGIKSD